MNRLAVAFAVLFLALVFTIGCNNGSNKPAQHQTAQTGTDSAAVQAPIATRSEMPSVDAGHVAVDTNSENQPTNQPSNSPIKPTEDSSTTTDSTTSGPAAGSPPVHVEKPDNTKGDMATAAKPVHGSSPAMQPAVKTASWSSQRLVLMGKGGPRFFKFDVNVGGVALDQGFNSSIAELARQLGLNFSEPATWEALLDMPLVSSGWLGNLVPNSEQREQLRQLYDTNNDSKVDEPEFRAFVTRGLSRNSFLKLSTRRSTAPQLPDTSAWGPVDQDRDGEITPLELNEASKTMLRYDFDGDRIITLAELRSATDNGSAMSSNTSASLLELTPVHGWEPDKPNAIANAIMESYSISDGLSKELLFAWPADKLKLLDRNGDESVDTSELKKISDQALDGQFQLSLSNQLAVPADKPNVNYQTLDQSGHELWLSHTVGGRLTLDGCIVTILLSDEQSASVREAFQLQFGRFAEETQFSAFLMQVLDLKEGALEEVKRRAEDAGVQASELAWRWLMAPRHWHVQLVWSASDSPWFELMDLNGDQKIVSAELDQFPEQARRWDHNKDGVIQYEEMPTSVLLEIKRPDARGVSSRLGGSVAEKRGTNEGTAPTWFTGMDYNSDGELSKGEFLGEVSDFEKFDLDRNGIIEAREVTTPQ